MDTILSFFTSNNNSDNLPNEIPTRDVFLQTETYNKFTGGAEYNKDTYIGHLKLKNGGMKIVKSSDDDRIKKERNIVLEHLHKSLNGGKIDGGNLPTYYKALEGGYIRNLICPTDSKTCSNFINNNKMAAYKLSKNALKNGYANTLKTFKQNAPKLYKNLKDSDFIKKLKYKRDKYLNRLSDGGSTKSDGSLSEHLSNLRNNVGTRNLNETGGYQIYNRNTGVWENKGEFGNATLGKLKIARDNELDEYQSTLKGNTSNLSSPLGGNNNDKCDDDDYDENCEYNPIVNGNISKKYQRKVSKEIRKLSKTNKGNVKRLSDTPEDIIIRRLIKERRDELENYKSMLKGNTSNLSSPASSRVSSPMSNENDGFYGGGDPLQELRMELGRL
jgi:hypothetical protein